jgi:heme exporter protein C
MLALLLGYVALRNLDMDPDRRAIISAVTGLAATLVIPVNHFAVTWWRTLHQGRSAATLAPSSNLDGSYIRAMFLGMLAMMLVYGWLLVHRVRVEAGEQDRKDDDLAIALAERQAEAVAP